MKKNKRLVFTLIIALFAHSGIAHEGHDSPGMLPPAPHGGVIGEAAHKVAHAPDGNEDELFFEVSYKDGNLKVYPLALNPKDTSAFKPLLMNQLDKVEVKVEFPRAKKMSNVTLTSGKDLVEGKVDAKRSNRFIVHINAYHNKETKIAKIQVEQP